MLNIYAHVTDKMRQAAAHKINRGIGKTEPQTEDLSALRKLVPSTFQAHNGKRRKAGTGCTTQNQRPSVGGRYSLVWPDGKKHPRNVYVKTRAECDWLLAETILRMKTEIAAEKERMRLAKQVG